LKAAGRRAGVPAAEGKAVWGLDWTADYYAHLSTGNDPAVRGVGLQFLQSGLCADMPRRRHFPHYGRRFQAPHFDSQALFAISAGKVKIARQG